MSFTEKIDALDLLITILKEHEKELDELTRRLERALDIVEEPIDRQLLKWFMEPKGDEG